MEQDSNHIDDLLRKRLYDAAVPPPAFVWPQVEAALRKRRRRFLFFWLFGAGLATSGLLALWLTTHSRPFAEKLQQHATAGQDVPKPITAPEAAALSSQGDKSVSASEKNMIPATGHVKTPATVSGKGETRATTGKAPARTLTPATVPSGAGIADATHVPAAGSSGLLENTQRNPATVTAISPVFPSVLSDFPLLTARFPKLRGPLQPSPVHAPINIVRNKKETRNCYDFSQHPNVLLLDAYLGPSVARKEMHTGPDNQPYLAQRRNTETRDWSFSAGLRASLLLDRHFLLRSGLHYDQVNEVFEYIDPNSVEVIIRQTTQIVNGQPVTVIDTLGVEYGEHYLKSYNRFGMLDIPLEAGVELRNGRNGVSLNGGIALNVLFWKRGAILSPVDGRPAYFTPGKGTVDVFRANAGLSAIGSIQWFCHVRPRLRVFAEPYARVVLRPVNVPGHPVEQRYGMLGLNIGMTRIFD